MKNSINLSSYKYCNLSIIVPVFNEQGNVELFVNRLNQALSSNNIQYEIIFIDDRSSDNTFSLIESLSQKYPIRLFKKKGRQGKAYSIIEGISYAKYNLIVMIDGDLQYPPESIPVMINEINKGFDVIVTNRKIQKTSLYRKIISQTFQFFFGRILHGMSYDIQSGLKIFKKEIFERITIVSGPWSFDLEFLTKARDAGYKIGSVDIEFDKRHYESPKINVISASWEIGLAAIKLKLKQKETFPFNKEQEAIKGKGFHAKGIEFIHHSNLSHHESAFHILYNNQKIIVMFFLLVIIFGLIINFKIAFFLIVIAVTLLYFFDLLFNLFLIVRSFAKNPEITINHKEVKDLTDEKLPTYTILCPLYHEWEVLPQFVTAITRLDYPKNKLQVILLLEEDDKETIKHVTEYQTPEYFETVIVPHSIPKTKPKALNYGLQKATGEYLVIYDAEDMPEPKQLKKAVIAFTKADPKTVCIQAKLNFYNPTQNLLTRVFTAEYSLWFDLVLTGLQSITAPIPLGGTSNHFRTSTLHHLKGWDSFNVTEDCDLGIRLAKRGYHTALINSITLEEANSDIKNWFNQRSRWIKGYIQTYLVHMRNPSDFSKSWRDPQFIFFQLIVGGKVLSMFINPFMWLMTILYFTMRSTFGVYISQFFPGPVLYIGVFSLAVGNFLYMYYYMIGCAKRGHYDLIKYVYLVPIYWLFMSLAAWQGLIQLIRRPHFWPKTIHGFHIDRNKALTQAFDFNPSKLAYRQVLTHLESSINIHQKNIFNQLYNRGRELVINLTKSITYKLNINKTWNVKTLSSGSFLIISMMIANIINFLINAFFGRILTFKDFGLLTLINAFSLFFGIVIGSLDGTINHRVAYLSSREGNETARAFFRYIFNKFIKISLILTIIWIGGIPLVSSFFNIHDFIPVLLFAPIVTFGLLEAVAVGYLKGSFSFMTLGMIVMISVLAKFALVLFFIILGLNNFSYLPLILIAIFSFALVYVVVYKLLRLPSIDINQTLFRFPKKFFLFNCIKGLSTTLFLTIDILLVNHFSPSTEAEKYALLSLAGKMIYFMGSLLNGFIFPFVARDEGLKQNTKYTFYRLLFGGSLMTLGMYIFIGPLGSITMPILFGAKTYTILPYLNMYAVAMTVFTISNIFLNYEISKKRYYSSLMSIFVSGLLIVGIALHHRSVQEIVDVILLVSITRLVVMIFSYVYVDKIHFVIVNIIDLIDAFKYKSKISEEKKFVKKILIFNWRDIKHRYSGGAEVYIHELAKRWVKLGYKVTLFCGNDGHCSRYEIIDGVEIVRRGGFYFVYVWAFLYYILKFRGKYDIIIDSENGIPFFTPLYTKEKKYLLIHHVHQEVFRKSLIMPLSWLAIFLETKLMPFVYNKVETITVSPSSKKDILDHKLTSKEPVIIYNGVDLSKYKPGIKNKNPLILYLGRLKYYKTLNVFIHSAYQVLRKFPKAEFIIAGDGEEKTGLIRLTNKLGIADKIKFLGKVSEEQKIDLYQKAWVFVNPSFMEGWGITSIEANACGTPVVAADVPGLRDSVKNPHTGVLVPHGNINDFTTAILDLIKNDTKRERFSKQAILWAQKFDWEFSVNKSLKLFYGEK